MMNAGNLKGKTRQTSDWRRRMIAFVSALTLLISSCGLTAFAETDEDIYSDPVTAPIPAANTSPEPEEGEAQATPAPEGQPETGTEPQETTGEETETEEEPEVSEEPEDLTVYEPGTLTAEADGIGITVDYTAEARVPEGAVLTLTRAAGGDLYSALKSASKVLKTEENATWKRELGEDAVFYAISLTNPEGNEVHPETGVTLTCTNLVIPADATGFVTGDNAENLDWKDTLTVGFLPDAIGYAYLKQVQIGTVTLTHEDRDYMVTAAYGPDAGFPADIELKVREILPGTPEYALYSGMTDEALNEDWAEITLERYFDIAFVANGEELEPKADVDVQIVFRDKIEQNEETEVAAVHIENNEANVIEAETDSTKSARHDDEAIDTVTFTSDSFSVYGVVQKKKIITKVLAADGNTYEIEISYTQEAEIPEESQVKVEEIPEGSDLWEAYRKQTAAALNADDVRLPGLYDISIIDAEGAKIEPKAPVSVSIKLANAENTEEELHVVHFTEEIPQELVEAEANSEEQTEIQPIAEEDKIESENIKANVEGDTVTFDTQGFSVYAFAYKIVTYYKTATGETYKITLNYDENSGIPEGSTLNVEEILPGDSRYNEYLEKALKAAGQTTEAAEIQAEDAATEEETNASEESAVTEETTETTIPENQYARFFDIEIRNNDQKIEPTGKVSVTFELADAPEDKLSDLHVVHFIGEGIVDLDADVESEMITFDTESFSVYGVLTYPQSTPPSVNYGLAGRSFKISRDGYYIKSTTHSSGPVRFEKTQNANDAAIWHFETTAEQNQYYIFTIVDGEKKYMNFVRHNSSNANAMLSDTPKAFTVTYNNNGTYSLKATAANINNEGAKDYYLNQTNGSRGNGFAGYENADSNSELTLTFLDPQIENNKQYMVLVFYDNEYYIVNNDASLTKVGYDLEKQKVVVDNPMLWTYNNNHIYFNLEAVSFNSDKQASDFYRRYLNPNENRAYTDENINNVTTYQSANSWFDAENNKWVRPMKINNRDTIWGRTELHEYATHIYRDWRQDQYVGVIIENGVPVKLAGNQAGNNAATILFADATAINPVNRWNHTVSHIDISIAGKADIDVPLAYGTYYYKDGGEWKTITITSNKTLHLSSSVRIEPEDMRGATIKAYDKTHTELDDAFAITGYSSNAHTNHSTVQVRIEGSFKVANLDPGSQESRKDNAITYEVSAIKNLNFNMEDPVYGQLYEEPDDNAKLIVNMDINMSASFNYYDSGNQCPPIQWDWDNNTHSTYWDWFNGGIPDGSGMDFVLGGDVEQADANTVALEITKLFVDESGKPIHPKEKTISTMDIYAIEGANDNNEFANSVSMLNVGQASQEVSYSGYEDKEYKYLHSKRISVGTSGIGLVYDYAVKPGMYFITEQHANDKLPETITDTDNREWTYKETYITTEYVRRGDIYDDKTLYPDPMHYSKNYTRSDSIYASVPEVLGTFETLKGTPKKSGIIEFFVYNVYTTEGTTSLEVEKDWALGTDEPENAEVDVELYYAIRKIKDGDTEIPADRLIDWPENPDDYSAVQGNSIFDEKLNTKLTLKADLAENQNWKGIFTGLPITIKIDEDTYEVDYYAKETAVRINGIDVTNLYIPTIVKNAADSGNEDTSNGTVKITNTPITTKINILKNWGESGAPNGSYVDIILGRYKLVLNGNDDQGENDDGSEDTGENEGDDSEDDICLHAISEELELPEIDEEHYHWEQDNEWSDTVRLQTTWRFDDKEVDAIDSNGNVYLYYIYEVKEHGFNSTYWDATIDDYVAWGDNAVNSEHPNKLLSVTNTYTPPEMGSILLKKIVTDDDSETDPTFDFTVFILDDDGEVDTSFAGEYFGQEFAEGYTVVHLKHNDTVLLNEIPVGTRYKITETPDSRYRTTIKVDNSTVSEATGTITTADVEIVIEFTNRRIPQVDISAEKTWSIGTAENQKPTAIKFLLQQAVGEEEPQTIDEKILVLSQMTNEVIWQDLDKFVDDTAETPVPYIYSIVESEVCFDELENDELPEEPTWITASSLYEISKSTVNNHTIVNNEPKTTDIEIIKNWYGLDDGNYTWTADIDLMSDQSDTPISHVQLSNTLQSVTIENLPKYIGKDEIQYSAIETSYTVKNQENEEIARYDGETRTGKEFRIIYADPQEIDNKTRLAVTNSKFSSKFAVRKEWIDVFDPSFEPTVYFEVYSYRVGIDYPQNGGSNIQKVTIKGQDRFSLSQENGWMWMPDDDNDLPARDNDGNALAYFAKEVLVNDVMESNNAQYVYYDESKYEMSPYSKEHFQVLVIEYENNSGNKSDNWAHPYMAAVSGENGGIITIRNTSPGKYIQFDLKKKFMAYEEDGSLATLTSYDMMMKNRFIAIQIYRRAVEDTPITVAGDHEIIEGTRVPVLIDGQDWVPYGDEIVLGYDGAGNHKENKGSNTFTIYYRSAWHWTIYESWNTGLPAFGFVNGKAVRYQYVIVEKGMYKDLEKQIPYDDEYEWGAILPAVWEYNNGASPTQILMFGRVIEGQDQDRLMNVQYGDLKIKKEWNGTPNAQEVYVKIYRLPDENYNSNDPKLEDFTNKINTSLDSFTNSKDGLLDVTHIYPNSGDNEPYGISGKCIRITPGETVHITKVRVAAQNNYYRYWAVEVGYKDLEGNVHFTDLDKAFTTAYELGVNTTLSPLEFKNDSSREGSPAFVIRGIGEGKNEVIITNTPKTGSLKIKKNVLYNGELTEDPKLNGTYNFTIESVSGVSPSVHKEVEIWIVDGVATKYSIDSGEDETITAGDGYVEITDLPEGDYVITEGEATTVLYSIAGGKQNGNTATRKITATVTSGCTGTTVQEAGKVVFTNNLPETTAIIEGTKVVENDISEDASGYSFELSSEDGTPMPEGSGNTATSDEDGSISFGPITYSANMVIDAASDGDPVENVYTAVFTYKVNELLPSGYTASVEDINNKYKIINGIKYDLEEKTVTVTVKYNSVTGKMEASVSPNKADLLFTNEKLGKIVVTKTVKLNGIATDALGKVFWVALYKNNDGNIGDLVDKATITIDSTGSGTVEFTDLPVGEYLVYELTSEDGEPVTGDNAEIGGYIYLDVITDNTNTEITAEKLVGSATIENCDFTKGITVMKMTTGKEFLAGAAFKVVKVTNAEGTEYAEGDEDAWSSEEQIINTNDGVIFDGLRIGFYKLVETTVPAGYLPLTESIIFEVSKEEGKDTLTITDKSSTTEMHEFVEGAGEYLLTVLNQAGAELPSTGGSGTLIYTITGIFLITLAGTLLVVRKRKANR